MSSSINVKSSWSARHSTSIYAYGQASVKWSLLADMLNFTFCEPLTDCTRALWWHKVSENARANNASIFRDFNSLGFRVGNGALCSPHKAGPGLNHLRFQFFFGALRAPSSTRTRCTRQPQYISKFSIFFRAPRHRVSRPVCSSRFRRWIEGV